MMGNQFIDLASCRTVAAALFLAGSLSACGHLVTGYSSIPYLDGTQRPSELAVHIGIPKAPLEFPGARVTINLWNDFYTSEPEARVFNRKDSVEYMMLLQVKPLVSNVRLEPKAVAIIIDGISYGAMSYDGSETDMRLDQPRGRKRQFASWSGRPDQDEKSMVANSMVLTEGCFYTLTIHYRVEKPTPDREIIVDLASALMLPSGHTPERIRFQKVLWQEMHQ